MIIPFQQSESLKLSATLEKKNRDLDKIINNKIAMRGQTEMLINRLQSRRSQILTKLHWGGYREEELLEHWQEQYSREHFISDLKDLQKSENEKSALKKAKIIEQKLKNVKNKLLKMIKKETNEK